MARLLCLALALLIPVAPMARPVPTPLRGVTVDSIDKLPALVEAVSAHSIRPTVRIVFDPGTLPSDYMPVIMALHPHAYIMGELVDSTALRRMTSAQVAARARMFARAFGDRVDIWEIGNELNGAWAGRNPDEINAKVLAAHRVIADEYHLRTAVTLNYWAGPHCYEKAWEPTLPFAQAMPQAVRDGADVVLLSVYETACSPAQHPTAADLARTLNRLGRLFPNARLGIGEIGAQGIADGLPTNPTLAEKKRIARTYYGMQPELRLRVGRRFAGGYFWWYYRQDAVPKDRKASLWPELERLLAGL